MTIYAKTKHLQVRKLLVTSAISILPGDATLQIPFAFMINSFSLLLSMKVSPFIASELGQLHVLSLTTQCVTLFAALLLEIQSTSESSLTASAASDRHKTVDRVIMDFLLIFFNLSITVSPMILGLHSGGYLSKAYNLISTRLNLCWNLVGFKPRKHKILWPHDDIVRLPSAGLPLYTFACIHTGVICWNCVCVCVCVCARARARVHIIVCSYVHAYSHYASTCDTDTMQAHVVYSRPSR